ncbi:CoA transferase, partial [Herbaspirillum sp.]|uniref:CoA transferase n=1 Tax=Herbaspirillum sp. TaxID=1890675 RepID=UPI0031E19A26
EREWKVFCEVVLEDAALAVDERFSSNSRRHEHRDALRQLILEMFSGMSAEQVVARLDQAQIANARVNAMPDLWQHPQLAARQRWTEVDTPAGRLPALLPPGVNDSYDYRMEAIPALGQHTDAILGGLGYDDAAIAALRARGAV